MIETLKGILNEESKKHAKDPKAKEFQKASMEFDRLVKIGLAKKRGYSLQTIDQMVKDRASYKSNG